MTIRTPYKQKNSKLINSRTIHNNDAMYCEHGKPKAKFIYLHDQHITW